MTRTENWVGNATHMAITLSGCPVTSIFMLSHTLLVTSQRDAEWQVLFVKSVGFLEKMFYQKHSSRVWNAGQQLYKWYPSVKTLFWIEFKQIVFSLCSPSQIPQQRALGKIKGSKYVQALLKQPPYHKLCVVSCLVIVIYMKKIKKRLFWESCQCSNCKPLNTFVGMVTIYLRSRATGGFKLENGWILSPIHYISTPRHYSDKDNPASFVLTGRCCSFEMCQDKSKPAEIVEESFSCNSRGQPTALQMLFYHQS